MDRCTNPEIGNWIHAYELRQLTEEENEKFEIHLMECDYCFHQVRKAENVINNLMGDKEIKAEVEKMVTGETFYNRFWRPLKEHLWPDTYIVLRPALAYFIILLLLVPAYLGIKDINRTRIKHVNTLTLTPDRDVSAEKRTSDNDLLLSFIFPGAEPHKSYEVRIIAPDKKVIYENRDFREFDNNEKAFLLIAASQLKSGTYTLTIVDPGEQPPYNAQEYYFVIEE
jgi:hypothetical protein